jgi:hypothetical protein
MNCRGNASSVAAQLNRLGQDRRAVTDVILCNNGCFNLEPDIAYTADDILQRFPDAWNDAPGL